jgi:hypothetical protein
VQPQARARCAGGAGVWIAAQSSTVKFSENRLSGLGKAVAGTDVVPAQRVYLFAGSNRYQGSMDAQQRVAHRFFGGSDLMSWGEEAE